MRKHFAMLDLSRGMAAFAVLGFHQPGGSFKLFAHGYLAVDFFFLLSGFVIAASYEERLVQQKLSVKRFIVTRMIRLYPLVVLGGIIGGISHYGLYPLYVVAGSMFLFPTIVAGSILVFSANPPAWSLFWEIFVNVVYAAIVKYLNFRAVSAITLAGLAAIIACAYQFKTMDYGFTVDGLFGGAARVTFSFFAGIVVYRLWAGGLRVAVPWYVVAAILLFALMLPATPGMWYLDLLIVLLFPVLVLLAANCELPTKMERPATFLGNISYPVYILQHGLGLPSRVYSTYNLTGASGFLVKWAWVGVICLLATAAFYFYDKPVRNWLNKRLKSRPSVAAATAP